MTRRVTSPTLIGRTDQLKALRTAMSGASVGSTRIVLVAGDAGIGKTRLVGEAVAQARADGVLTAVGGCIQLGEVSVAFAPLVEALRELRAQLGDAEVDELLDSGHDQLRALLGGAGAPAQGSGPLFEHLLGFLTRLAQRRPVLMVFEDLHWADASTRDLIAFLGRNLRDAPLTFAMTFRGDELHRRHPLRPVLGDLERAPHVERIELDGLRREELTGLLAEISEQPLSERAVDELLARSGGNPFYVEELIAAGAIAGGVPDTLAEVILRRVEAQSAETQQVLRAAAVVDDTVDDELLAEVTGRPLDQITAALRAAVFDQLLVLDGDTCRFRHALVREALYDDLLPGERTRLHVATASVLERAERLPAHTRWAMLAHHWDAARDTAKAFTASVRAGLEAEQVHAFADAAEQYERALGLRAHVPDPEAQAGMSTADLLLRAADAVQASARSHRGIVLAEAALAELGPHAAPERRALIYERIGRINWTLHRGPAAVAAYERGAELLADRPASREQAFTLSALGQSLMVRARYREAGSVLERAIAVAEAVSATDVQGHALASLGPCLVGLGRVEEGLAAMRQALALSGSASSGEDVSRAYTNLVHCLYVSGRYDEAARAGREGIEYAVRAGYARHYGEAIAANAIAALFCAGRWREAEAVRADPRVPVGDPYQELRWLPLLMASGRYDEARTLIEAALVTTAEADDVQFRAAALLRAGEIAAIDGRWDDARELIAAGIERAARSDDRFYPAQAYALALAVEADRVAAAGPRAEREVAEARAVADRLCVGAQRLVAESAGVPGLPLPEPGAWLITAEAEHARACGRDEPDGWAAVAAEWRRVGQPYPAAVARYRQAEALLRLRGGRGMAAEAARDALRVADALGAAPLAEEVRALAARGRLELSDATPPGRHTVADLHITRRELEVLGLVVEGRTNRQIGEKLFISEKTASVHVTNLLRKLGVANRVEAAAVAQRSGITAQAS